MKKNFKVQQKVKKKKKLTFLVDIETNDVLQTVVKAFGCLYFCLLKIFSKETVLGTLPVGLAWGETI